MDTHGRWNSNIIIIVKLFASVNLDLMKAATEAVAWRCFLKDFAKFNREDLWWNLIFIKLNNVVETPKKKKETKWNFIKKLELLLYFDYTFNVWNFKNWNTVEVLKYVIGLLSVFLKYWDEISWNCWKVENYFFQLIHLITLLFDYSTVD